MRCIGLYPARANLGRQQGRIRHARAAGLPAGACVPAFARNALGPQASRIQARQHHLYLLTTFDHQPLRPREETINVLLHCRVQSDGALPVPVLLPA